MTFGMRYVVTVDRVLSLARHAVAIKKRAPVTVSQNAAASKHFQFTVY